MIKLRKVTKKFGALTAVDALSLEVPSGELFCFLGPNGAGKTTTIKMMCGLLRPTSGEIEIDGIDVRKNIESVRRITGYVPDTPFLYDRLTVNEFYRFVGDLYDIPREHVETERKRMFALFGLEEYAETFTKDLSHGWRQRLTYAATLLHEPRVLFVDEPFVGLDPHSIRLLKQLLREQTARGAVVFMTTHILALIEDLADRVGIIHHGRLIALDTVDALKQHTAPGSRLEDIFLEMTEDA